MASLRTGTKLWLAEAIGAAAEKSNADNPGSATHLAIFVKNTGTVPAVITIEAAGPVEGGVGAGRNAMPTDDADWYVYNRITGAGVDILPVTFSVANGESAVIDLSPFAPPFVRLSATGDGAILTAYAQGVTSG